VKEDQRPAGRLESPRVGAVLHPVWLVLGVFLVLTGVEHPPITTSEPPPAWCRAIGYACFVLFILLGMGLTWTINPTVAQHKAEAAQAPATQTVGGEAAGDAEAGEQTEADTEGEEGEVPTVGDLDATLDAVQEAAGQTAPPEPATPADDDDAVMTDRPEEPASPTEPDAEAAPDDNATGDATEDPDTPAE